VPQPHNSDLHFLEAIAESLLTKVKLVRTSTKHPQCRIEVTSLNGITGLDNYLANYPLMSSKYLDSMDWLKVLSLLKLGSGLSCRDKTQTRLRASAPVLQGGDEYGGASLEVEKLIFIKSKMNDKRTVFN